MKNQVLVTMKLIGRRFNFLFILTIYNLKLYYSKTYNYQSHFKNMPIQNAQEIKDKIMAILRIKGPSLPVHVSTPIGISMLFAGAFLSELMANKQVKTSHMKVGGSPIYLIPGQEPLLERYQNFIKGKEKEALLLLKEKKFLKDIELEPAIRVALRSLQDFAIPFKHGDSNKQDIYWKYFIIPLSEFNPTISVFQKREIISEIKEQQLIETTPVANAIQELPISLEKLEPIIEINKKPLDIFDKKDKSKEKPKEKQEKKKQEKKKLQKKAIEKTSQNQENKFLNKIKQYLQNNSMELIDIESFSKNTITLKINKDSKTQLLIAHNKKKLDEKDIINAYKKASELNLDYIVLGLGVPLKKISEFVEASKSLSFIDKIE